MNFTTENYLKIIYTLQESEPGEVKPQQLAKILQVTPAAVTDMLKKLSEEHLITYAPYKGVGLTKKGKATGQNMVRRHRLWEMYLHKILGFAWDKVHQEAELLEHASSDELINRIEEALGFPKFDPHGEPIPSKDGVVPVHENVATISECKVGDEGKIVRVNDINSEFLQHVASLGICLGEHVKILSHLPFDLSVSIQTSKGISSISSFTAQHLFIKKEKI